MNYTSASSVRAQRGDRRRQPPVKTMTITAGTNSVADEIRSKLAREGWVSVYLAEDTRLHRKVALKILPLILLQTRIVCGASSRKRPPLQRSTIRTLLTYTKSTKQRSANFITMEFVDRQTLREENTSRTNRPPRNCFGSSNTLLMAWHERTLPESSSRSEARQT